ncbi:hypothetical protein Tco_0869304 [Tanacetum coccineum]
MRYSFYNPSENKVFVARNVEFFESNVIDQEAKDDQETDEPQSDINPIRRSTSTKRAPDRMCLYIDVEEHELGDLGEPANYKATLMDPESKKCAYIGEILKRVLLEILTWSSIPMQEKLKLSKADGASTPAEKVSCYTDAGYLTDADDLKSQTGYVFVLNRGVVDWKSTKQKPITMYCDNTGAISIENDHGVTKGEWHFRVKVHYLRENIDLGDVRIEKVDIDDNLANPITKALAFPKHSELTRKIGLIPARSLM